MNGEGDGDERRVRRWGSDSGGGEVDFGEEELVAEEVQTLCQGPL